jgi:hypothetical protein
MAVANILFRVSADIKGLQAGTGDAERALTNLQRTANQVGDRLANLFPTGGGLAAGARNIATEFGNIASSIGKLNGAIGGIAIGALVSDFVNTTSRLTDLSAQTSLTTRELQRFQYAGDLVGVGLDQITGAVGQLQNRLGSLDKAALSGLEQLGLTIQEIQRLEPGAQFEAIATRLSQIEDPSKRAALAMDLFGRTGIQLLPLMRTNLKEVGDEAERLGIVLSDKTVAAGDQLGDLWTRLVGMGRRLVADGLQPVTDLLDRYNQRTKDIAREKEFVANAFAKVGLDVRALSADVRELNGLWQSLQDTWRKTPSSLPNLPSAPSTGVGAFNRPSMTLEQADALADRLKDQLTELNQKRKEDAASAKRHADAVVDNTWRIIRAAERRREIEEEAAFSLQLWSGRNMAALRDMAAASADTRFAILTREMDKQTESLMRMYDAAVKARTGLDGLNLGEIGTRVDVGSLGVPAAPTPTNFQQFQSSLDTLGRSMSQLGSVTDSVRVRAMAGFITALDVASKAGQGLGVAFENIKKAGGSLVSGFMTAAGNVIAGISALMQSTGKGSTKSRVAGGALSGAAIGTAILPGWGTAIGAVAGAITGLVRGMNQGRNAVKDFAESFGGFDALRQKMNELGDEGETLWVKLTQGVGRGDAQGAQAAIDAITAAFERQRQKTLETGQAAEQAAADTIRAQESMTAPLKQRIADLTQEYDRLFESIRDEAPEEVMGIVEQQTRARMEAIAKDRQGVEKELSDLQDSFKESMGSVTDTLKKETGIAAREMVYELEDVFSGTVLKIPYEFVPTNQPGGIPALGSGGIVTRPTLALVGESGPEAVIPLGSSQRLGGEQRITVVVDGQVLTQAVVRGMPRELVLQGVR